MLCNIRKTFCGRYRATVLGLTFAVLIFTFGSVDAQEFVPSVITGKVVSDLGIPGAQIAVQVRTMDDQVVLTIFTDLEGVFKIYNLPQGVYKLVLIPIRDPFTNQFVSKDFTYETQTTALDVGLIEYQRPN